MKRLTIAAAAVLLMLLSVGSVAAHDNDRHGDRHGDRHSHKITICHNPTSAAPVTITVSKSAMRAHLAHGDFVVTPTTPCLPKPRPAQTVCTFAALTSNYYNGLTATSAQLYATGPIRFSWTTPSGAVVVPGGSWTETTVSPPATYSNLVIGGSVSGTGAVSLTFHRVAPAYSFAFVGTLVGSTLSGKADGENLLLATGTTTCVAVAPVAIAPGGHDHDDD